MNSYAKLIDGKLETMRYPKNISNPTVELLSAYAADHGYKVLRYASAPSVYHSLSYEESADFITQLWSPPSLADLKLAKKAEADAAKDAALAATVTLEVEDVGAVRYDVRAELTISSLIVLADDDPQAYILADDSVVMLTLEPMLRIALAFKAHVNGIYAQKIARYAAIDAATDVESLLLI